MPSQDYFAFHPLRWRGAVLFLAMALAAAAAFSFHAAIQGQVLGWALGAVSASGASGLAYLFFRLRPRSNWGIRVLPLALVVDRLGEGSVDIPWNQVKQLRRTGKTRGTVELWVGADNRLRLHRVLFSSQREFDALVRAIEERMPALPYDA